MMPLGIALTFLAGIFVGAFGLYAMISYGWALPVMFVAGAIIGITTFLAIVSLA